MRCALLLCISVFLLTSCGTYVREKDQANAKQTVADSDSAIQFIVSLALDPAKAQKAYDSLKKMHANYLKIVGVDPNVALPQPNVSLIEWKGNVDTAKSKQDESTKKVADDSGTGAILITTLTTVGLLLLRGGIFVGAKTNLPIVSQACGLLDAFISMKHPQEVSVADATQTAIERYKDDFPEEWRKNQLFIYISDAMTQRDKDYVKQQQRS